MIGNSWGVGTGQDGTVQVLLPPTRLTPRKAMELAAWLVSVAEVQMLLKGERVDRVFEDILREVQG